MIKKIIKFKKAFLFMNMALFMTGTAALTTSPLVAHAAAVATVEQCTIQVNNPHNSTHVPGQVNVVGTVTCTVPVTNMWIDINLYYNGMLYAANYNYANYGAVFATIQANMNCLPGAYYAIMNVGVQWPAGYTPSYSPATVQSNPVSISC